MVGGADNQTCELWLITVKEAHNTNELCGHQLNLEDFFISSVIIKLHLCSVPGVALNA